MKRISVIMAAIQPPARGLSAEASPRKIVAKMPWFADACPEWALALAVGFGALTLACEAQAWPGLEISMSNSVHPAADAAPLAPKEAAEKFLAEALPAATAANPKFRTGEGVLSAWITRTVKFEDAKGSNDVIVSMSEDALEFRNGAQTATNSHDVAFSLGAVAITERRDLGTIAETGEPAMSVMFQCNAGKCIRAAYDGKPADVDMTDISIQDAAARAKVLAAFQMLKGP
jgi:hypothetical protein